MQFITNLGGLRFLLALAIVVEHVLLLSPVGHCCVNIFFVISGFLLERKRLSKGNLRATDIKKTIIRLTPGYVLMLIVFFFIQYLILKKLMFISLLAHLVYVQTWFLYTYHQLLNSPTWFLSVYVSIILFFFLTQKLTATKKVVIVVVLLAVHLCLGFYFNDDADKAWWYYNFPVAQLAAFYGGCCLAVWFERRKELKRLAGGLLLQVSSFILVIATIFIVYSDWIPFWLGLNLIYVPASIFIVWVMVRTDNQNTFINKFLGHKSLQIGGGAFPYKCLSITSFS